MPCKGTVAACTQCGQQTYVMPLHGDNGGPLHCPLCAGAWHAKHGRKRRIGRVVIRAMRAFEDAGGTFADIDKLKIASSGFLNIDPLRYLQGVAETGNEIVELTSELLADAIKIAHPDLHPPERRDLAQRVTQGLLALQPFVFPAPEQKPPPPAEARDDYFKSSSERLPRPSFPCVDCSDTVPFFYCDPCRVEWEKRQEKEREQERLKRCAWRTRRKEKFDRTRPPCAACGKKFKGKRKDARLCSDTCRQRAHRSVTDKRSSTADTVLAVTTSLDGKRRRSPQKAKAATARSRPRHPIMEGHAPAIG
jgi:hypothetical protein